MKKTNVIVNQGSTSSELVELKKGSGEPVNLTGFTAKSHVRLNYDSPTPILELSTEDGSIVLGAIEVDGEIEYGPATNGGIEIKYDGEVTKLIKFKGSELRGVRDVELTDALGVTRRIVEGEFILTREVTHD